jgi:hypothetical protein
MAGGHGSSYPGAVAESKFGEVEDVAIGSDGSSDAAKFGEVANDVGGV